MHSITRAAVRVYRAEMEAGRATVTGRASRGSERAVYNIPVDNELYEWLRTAAFSARTSISAVIDAALAYAQAAQPEGTVTPDAD